jgi:hypothetical protein
VTSATINTNASGTWARYGELSQEVEIVEFKPNRMAVYVMFPGEKKRSGPIPERWLTYEEEPTAEYPKPMVKVETQEVCPCCGQPIIKEKAT